MNYQNKVEIKDKISLNGENFKPKSTKQTGSFISPKNHVQKQILKKQFNLLKNKQVRAVPGGYHSGLIDDMHKSYVNFQEKGTILQMDHLNPLVQQTSELINRFNEEFRLQEKKLDKCKAPRTLNALSIQCTLPYNYEELEHLSPLSFLVKYAKPLINREHIVMRLMRKMHFDSTVDIEDAKHIVFEYFNHYKTRESINELFDFLKINLLNKFQLKEIIVICCYAERYFLHKLKKNNTSILFERSLQEIIDFEFLKRKFDGLKLTDELKNLIKTLQAPEN